MTSLKILFIGGGNMTRAMVSGLISNHFDPKNIVIFDRNALKRENFLNQYAVNAADQLTTENLNVDVIVLAVKPQSAKEICTQIKSLFKAQKPLIISVMTGISINTLHDWLGKNTVIVRAMPNTPAQIKAGATGLFAADNVSEEQKQLAEILMSAIGMTAWLDGEKQIDMIIALSGSGPAYFFYFMEAMQSTAIKMGLPEKIAKQFAIQTAYGAALLALQSEKPVDSLRAEVTSKGGTTQAAMTVFDQEKLFLMVEKAMNAAKNRSEEVAGQFGVYTAQK